MSAITKNIAAGQPRGYRGLAKIQGVGRICSVPEMREWTNPTTKKVVHFLNVRVIINEISANEDGSATQYSEFIELSIAGGRAEALGKVLGKRQPVYFEGRLRTRTFDSKKFFDSEGKPAQMTRTECMIGQDGNIIVMHFPEDAEKAPEKPAQAPLAPDGIKGNHEMALQFQALMAAMANVAPPAQEPVAAAETVVDLGNEYTDDDIPF